MGTKRPFDEDLQEFIKHPKHLENGIKPDSFGEDKHSLETSRNVEIAGEDGTHVFHTGNDPVMVHKAFETSASLPLVTNFSGREDASGHWPAFCSNLFPEFFEFNMPRRQPVHHDDAYSSLLHCSPRKEIPIGPEHQANVPEFDSEAARNYISTHGREESLMGICVISNKDSGDSMITHTECKCLDGGSIRCVQQHVTEKRLKLKEFLGLEKFNDLGLDNVGEEVASNWTEEQEQLFQDVVYSNPVSLGKRFWEELSIAFPAKTKKEIVSYYFNVFILRRRAVQNRSQLLAIDSDDDEWWGSRRGSSGVIVEDQDLVVVGPFVDHGQHHDSSSEDGDDGDNNDVIGNQINGSSSSDKHDEKVENENEQEKPVNVNKQEGNNGGLRSESYLHWDPPYSTMGSMKGVDLLPTCSMIEEIFGSSKTGKST